MSGSRAASTDRASRQNSPDKTGDDRRESRASTPNEDIQRYEFYRYILSFQL